MFLKKNKFIFVLLIVTFFPIQLKSLDHENSLNKNILEHGWKIVSQTDGGLVATEIYKLKKNGWILICNVQTAIEIRTDCKLP